MSQNRKLIFRSKSISGNLYSYAVSVLNINGGSIRSIEASATTFRSYQSITFNSLAERIFGDGDFEINAVASSGLSVSFESSEPSVATINGSQVTIVAAGTAVIKAIQSGNENFNPADVEQILVVNSADQSVTFNSLAERIFGDGTFEIEAIAGSGIPVSFESLDPSVAIINGIQVAIVGAGTTLVRAIQNGNENYKTASEVLQTLTVNKADQIITFSDFGTTLEDFDLIELMSLSSRSLPLRFESSNTNVASIHNSVVLLHGIGATVITVFQDGNNNCHPTESVSRTLTVSTLTAVETDQVTTQFDIYPNPNNRNNQHSDSKYQKPLYFGTDAVDNTFQLIQEDGPTINVTLISDVKMKLDFTFDIQD